VLHRATWIPCFYWTIVQFMYVQFIRQIHLRIGEFIQKDPQQNHVQLMCFEQARIHFHSVFYQFILEITLIEHFSSNLICGENFTKQSMVSISEAFMKICTIFDRFVKRARKLSSSNSEVPISPLYLIKVARHR